jgi:hypothetical protein
VDNGTEPGKIGPARQFVRVVVASDKRDPVRDTRAGRRPPAHDLGQIEQHGSASGARRKAMVQVPGPADIQQPLNCRGISARSAWGNRHGVVHRADEGRTPPAANAGRSFGH